MPKETLKRKDKMDLHEEIAKVALELYERSGKVNGRDLENWIEAEKIVKARHANNEFSNFKKQMEWVGGEAIAMFKEITEQTMKSMKTLAEEIKKNTKSK